MLPDRSQMGGVLPLTHSLRPGSLSQHQDSGQWVPVVGKDLLSCALRIWVFSVCVFYFNKKFLKPGWKCLFKNVPSDHF